MHKKSIQMLLTRLILLNKMLSECSLSGRGSPGVIACKVIVLSHLQQLLSTI